jgi:DNA-binding NarL/FixJ family response regulator
VKTNLVRVYSKRGAPDRTSAVTLAVERGYLRL